MEKVKLFLRSIIWVGVISMFLAGCVSQTHMKRRMAYVESHPNIESAMKQHIMNGDIALGMTKDEVIASWGEPSQVNRTLLGNVISEQWIYELGYADSKTLQPMPRHMATGTGPFVYIYFDNGIVTAIQD